MKNQIETKDNKNQLHSFDDKPAIVWSDGKIKEWYKHGQRHREDDKPAIIWGNGKIFEWYKHGQLHREGDKPAVESFDGGKEWYKHGQRHRIFGPAILWANGEKHWFIGGKRFSEDEFFKEIKRIKKDKLINIF